MRTIDGHFTVVNEPGTARELAANLLEMFESVRSPEHIIITEALLEQGAIRAQGVLSNSLTQSINKLDVELAGLEIPDEKATYPKIDKGQATVLEATNRAERSSTKKNWRKLDKARKALAKQLDKAGFASYTVYVDFINTQGVGGVERRDLLRSRDELVAQKKRADNLDQSLKSLSQTQIITVLADVLSRAPRTPVGPLPIVIDDALRNVPAATRLRALEVLKAHSSHYATWYITNDPLVLGWAGFVESFDISIAKSESGVYNIQDDVAS